MREAERDGRGCADWEGSDWSKAPTLPLDTLINGNLRKKKCEDRNVKIKVQQEFDLDKGVVKPQGL